jgi:integrase
MVSRLFKTLTRRAALPVIRFHGLRHTSASLALAAGVAMKVVSERLGHSTTGITADLYTHVVPAVAQDAADAIARLIAVESGKQ